MCTKPNIDRYIYICIGYVAQLHAKCFYSFRNDLGYVHGRICQFLLISIVTLFPRRTNQIYIKCLVFSFGLDASCFGASFETHKWISK